MITGTVRPEEAKVFDEFQGCHTHREFAGAFEIFWDDEDKMHGSSARNFDEDGNPVRPGWYWVELDPDGKWIDEIHGPFARSRHAYEDAMDENT